MVSYAETRLPARTALRCWLGHHLQPFGWAPLNVGIVGTVVSAVVPVRRLWWHDSAREALASGGEIPQLSPSRTPPTSWASDKALRPIYERIAAIDGRCIASDDPRLTQSAPAQRPSAPPTELSPTTPEFNDAVTACRSIVRQATNRDLAQYNSQEAKLNSQDGLHVPMMESKFDAYALPDGRLRALGTQAEYVSFSKCMNDRGYPIEQR